jgi:hypothetical protein
MIPLDIATGPGPANADGACALRLNTAPGDACAACGRAAGTAPSPDCARHAIEQHMLLVRAAVDRAIAFKKGLGGQDDIQVGMVKVLQHAAAMIGLPRDAWQQMLRPADPTPAAPEKPAPTSGGPGAGGGLLWF